MRAVLTASAGGHLEELYELATRVLPASTERYWITPRSPQSDSLLRDERVTFVPPVGSRQGGRAVATLPRALRLLNRLDPDVLVSTGAALTTPYMVAARLMSVRVHYVESATRLAGPSVTGRLAHYLPGTQLWYQSTGWDAPWKPFASVFKGFQVSVQPAVPSTRKVLVTLGTERFPFARAVHEIARWIPADVEVVWQLGHTDAPPGLPGDVRQFIPYAQLVHLARTADLVVSHAGAGSALVALRAGKLPVLFARRAALGEHVDDHQDELAGDLERLGVAVLAGERQFADVVTEATASRVTRAQKDWQDEPLAVSLTGC